MIHAVWCMIASSIKAVPVLTVRIFTRGHITETSQRADPILTVGDYGNKD